MTLIQLEQAARARRDQTGQRSHRPRERDSRAVFRSLIRAEDAGADTVHFEGLASAYEQGYEMHDVFGPYTEIVSAGAASRSLARTDLDVPLVLQHDQMRRIARTTNGTLLLRESSQGLQVDAPALDMRDQDVAYIVPKLRAGLIDEMSFAFRIIRGQWSPDYTEYRIEEFDIHRGDVAIVGYGANPYTDAGTRQRGIDLIAESETRMLEYI